MQHRHVRLGLLMLLFAGCNRIGDITLGQYPTDPVCDGVPEGTAIAEQIAGDCAKAICNDLGRIQLVADETDIFDDGNPCTEDTCEATFGRHDPIDWGICYTGPEGTRGVGICRAGLFDCHGPHPPMGQCLGQVLPSNEVCDDLHLDENCNGQIDEEGPFGCYCGDGFVQPSHGEQCDDGNDDPTDTCALDCRLPACGDGYVQPSAGEQCDDGNTLDADGCSSTCQYAVHLALGALHTCIAFEALMAKCWGENLTGQLGQGHSLTLGDQPSEMGSNLAPINLGTGMLPLSIAAGYSHSCALLVNGSVKCWGEGYRLGLGIVDNRGDELGEMGDALPAVDLGTGQRATAIAVGSGHTCARLVNGSVKCWGDNLSGQLGLGDVHRRGDEPGEMGDALPVVDLGTGQTAKAISLGDEHSCALLANGSIKCWGDNRHGQLGLGDTYDRGDAPSEMGDMLPVVDLGTGKVATAIGCGQHSTCALLSDGSVKCWGLNDFGKLGLGDVVHRGDTPNEMGDLLPAVDLGTDERAVALSVGTSHQCALLMGGRIKCWGNSTGLGAGNGKNFGDSLDEMGDVLPTVDVGMNQTPLAVGAGGLHSCAWLASGQLKCWGFNDQGQLGLGDTATRGDQPGEMGDVLPVVSLW